jgi:hypothetical protein
VYSAMIARFTAPVDDEETQIEASFCEAIRIAREQKSISMAKRAHEPTHNITGKKRARQEEVGSDYLFGNAQYPA